MSAAVRSISPLLQDADRGLSLWLANKPGARLHAREAADAIRAERLYPESPYLQAEWLRAIRVVRTTSRGWLLDQPQGRRA